MQKFTLHRSKTKLFGQQQLDLVYNQGKFNDFINQEFSLKAIESQITEKGNTFSDESRKLLVTQLLEQNKNAVISDKTKENINALSDSNTFTITTGHQLSLFTGPLYFIVKIVHVIKMCEELKVAYPNNNFVPVYWMASEDHDFEEIQSANIFNQKFTWNSNQKGPVGKFDLDESFETVKNELLARYNNATSEELKEIISAYEGDNFTEASRNLVNALFSAYGLIIIDGDDVELKRSFSDFVKKELTEQFSSKAIEKTNALLEKEGVKLQVKSRDINLFYLDKGIRVRIVEENGQYLIEGVGSFSENEILQMLEEHPQQFSPNVILRPVYQELILPNLTYVGGGGEISYWLQLKSVFEAAGVLFPLIQVRNSFMWIDAGTSKKMNAQNLSIEDLFQSEDELKKNFISENEAEALDFKLLESKVKQLTEVLSETIITVEKGLEQYSNAEIAKLNKQIDGVKNKLMKASKAKHSGAMKKIEQIKSKLFPANGLQERHSNFFNFCMDGDVSSKIEAIYSVISPFEKDLIILEEN